MENIDTIIIKIKNCVENNTHQQDKLYQSLNDIYNSYKSENNKKEIIDSIHNDFLSDNMFFYNKTSKLYYNYTDNNYVLLNEDNMIHYILEYISNNKEYRQTIDMSIKNIIKQNIMKSIKETSIYDTIPDTDTIQYILNILVPTMFESKEYAKIFLIFIGNIILKKNQINDHFQKKTIVFIKSQIKPFLNEINKFICMYFCNNNIFNSIKFKYTNDHSICDKIIIPCKLICYNVLQFHEQFYINFICVAIYYSNRYNTIDTYIDSVIGDLTEIKKHIYYFQNNTKESTITWFKQQYIIENKDTFIEQKDLLFLWKQFIQNNDLTINVFTSYQDFLNYLFNYFNQSFNENENNNLLHGFYSMEIPTIELFRDFWDKNFEINEDEFYFEISEILHLFHNYHKQKKTNLSESTIILILQLYYSHYNIVNNKNIHNLTCKLWNKKKEIDTFILNETINIKENIHSLYKKYSLYQNNKLKISKKYFTMYIEVLRDKLKDISKKNKIQNP